MPFPGSVCEVETLQAGGDQCRGMEGFGGRRSAQALEGEVRASHLHCSGADSGGTEPARVHGGASTEVCGPLPLPGATSRRVDGRQGETQPSRAQLSWWSRPFPYPEILTLLHVPRDISSEDQVWRFSSTSTFQRTGSGGGHQGEERWL